MLAQRCAGLYLAFFSQILQSYASKATFNHLWFAAEIAYKWFILNFVECADKRIHVPKPSCTIISIVLWLFSFKFPIMRTRLLSLVELLSTPSNVRFIRILKFLQARGMLGSDWNWFRTSHLTQWLRFSCQSFHETYISISTKLGLRVKFCVS